MWANFHDLSIFLYVREGEDLIHGFSYVYKEENV